MAAGRRAESVSWCDVAEEDPIPSQILSHLPLLGTPINLYFSKNCRVIKPTQAFFKLQYLFVLKASPTFYRGVVIRGVVESQAGSRNKLRSSVKSSSLLAEVGPHETFAYPKMFVISKFWRASAY